MKAAVTVPLFTLSYLPPLLHLQRMAACKAIEFDNGLYFKKQTLRNRCHILSPNGPQTLVIPTVHTGGRSQPLGKVAISYSDHWQQRHWRSLEAAYRRSPFFEFYEDDLRPIYQHRYELLTQFNAALLGWLFNAFGIATPYSFSADTPGPGTFGDNDYRILSETGQPATDSTTPAYLQVFGATTGFVGGLSAVDALFNNGPAVRKAPFLQPPG